MKNVSDKPRDECGVFGIWGHSDSASCTALGLTALQHRGQDSSGIAVSKGGLITCVCRSGGPSHLLADNQLSRLNASVAIGHVRYSTVGGSGLKNAQPLVLQCPQGQIALCHNGQIVNFRELKQQMRDFEAKWLTESDSELVLQMCRISNRATVLEAMVDTLGKLKGAFSLLVLANDQLIAARDPHGFRPLCMGRLGDAVIVCSETCALDALGAVYVREVEPGEICVIGAEGVLTLRHSVSTESAHCIFEHVYFARPDSNVFGDNVGSVRARLGRNLAREAHVDADLVVPIPESGMWVALGYQEESGLPLRLGLVRNSYMGRMFIEPSNRRSASNARLKLNPVRSILDGQRVVLIDDSIVRGETMAGVVDSIRLAGAREVHVRIGSPPTISSCFYGINTPTNSELIAASHSVEEVRTMIGADSLRYLSLEGLLDAVGAKQRSYCTACYTGDYRVRPTHVPAPFDQADVSHEHNVVAITRSESSLRAARPDRMV